MKKLLLGLFLTTMPLVGCGVEDGSALPDASEFAVTTDGQEMSIEQRDATPGEQPPEVGAANVRVSENELACWVVLEYCRHPNTGKPHCTATGCTLAEAIRNCEALIRRTCG
ncbi:hypothetical protein [Comamonas sp. JC664]|uniref:hypothetical protein n=1 Tax=Comamonas sp. JC664 TaxID=2801917 RepID=UPI00174A6F94|nr:hypothetical protein [Comamonas sp. JC664]MBL0692538.1 hypothetical protein [Comamonas sp. JC664]GHG92452.1 hypothetical protein GCM10012319_53990 [Comamonas sp. KCTC 72670]